MNLDDTQQARVREWIESGLDLSEIQTKLSSELDLSMTYMEVRFLVDDLGVLPKDPEPDPEPEAAEPDPGIPGGPGEMPGAPAGAEPMGGPAPAPAPPGPEAADPFGAGSGEASKVSVTVDQITRAGALASGKVTFSDGKSAAWTLDQMGRLGLSAEEPGYKPPQEDLMDFQVELQKKLSGPRF